jgi:hypothetical protein
MSDNIDIALNSVTKSDIANSTFSKVDGVLQTLEKRKEAVIMKPKLKKSFAAAIVAAVLVLSSASVFAANYDAIIGVIFRQPPHKTVGTYTAEGDSTAMVALQEGNNFALQGSEYISYVPSGIYRIENGKLFLDMGDYDIIFIMEKDRLVFESGAWLEMWVETGTVFLLE